MSPARDRARKMIRADADAINRGRGRGDLETTWWACPRCLAQMDPPNGDEQECDCGNVTRHPRRMED